jgi:hypothetical protein
VLPISGWYDAQLLARTQLNHNTQLLRFCLPEVRARARACG